MNIIGVGPFADNGSGTEQDRVFLLQGNGSSIAQTINNLSVGEPYTLLVSLNGRNCCGAEDTFYELAVGGEVITSGQMRPVGGASRYRILRALFIPTDVSTEIRIRHTSPTGDHTLLVDNVRVLKGDQPVPLPLTSTDLKDGTVRIEWASAESDGMVLQSAPSPDGPWTDVAKAPTVEGESNVVIDPAATSARFYRLAK